MIKPTVGRVVWFWPNRRTDGQPQAAIVTYVHGDRMVNLVTFTANGTPVGETSVTLWQDGDPTAYRFCEWMPYQLGQAAKTEALMKGYVPLGSATEEQQEQRKRDDYGRPIPSDPNKPRGMA